MSSAGSWWCHQCNVTIGQPRSASRPVCPHCDGGFIEEVKNGNHGAKGLEESMARVWRREREQYLWYMDMGMGMYMPMDKTWDIARGIAMDIVRDIVMDMDMDIVMDMVMVIHITRDIARYMDRDIARYMDRAKVKARARARAKARVKEILMAKAGHGRDIPAILAMAQGSEARNISGRSLISPSSRSEDLVHEDKFLRRRRSRGENMLTCSLHSVPFKRRKYARRMSCSHVDHADCIPQHNSCPACRDKKSTDDPEYDRMHSCGRNDISSSGTMGISGARFDSHGPVSPYLSHPHGHEHDDECLPEDRRRMMRRNMGECSRGPRVEQLLQEPVESDPGRRGPPLAWRALADSLVEVEVRGKDVAAQCAMCKGEFEIGKYAKRMPCSHMYHANCIRQWLAQHNSCPACRMHSRGRNETSFSGGRSRFSHIRPFRASMKTFQQAQAETSSGSDSRGKTVSSFFHDTRGNNFGLDDDGDVIMQDAME